MNPSYFGVSNSDTHVTQVPIIGTIAAGPSIKYYHIVTVVLRELQRELWLALHIPSIDTYMYICAVCSMYNRYI